MDIRTILDPSRLGTVWRTPPVLEEVPPSAAAEQTRPAAPQKAPEPASALLRAVEAEILRTFGEKSPAAAAVAGVIATLRGQVAAMDAASGIRAPLLPDASAAGTGTPDAAPAAGTGQAAAPEPALPLAPPDLSLYDATAASLDALEDLLDAFLFAGPWAPPAQM